MSSKPHMLLRLWVIPFSHIRQGNNVVILSPKSRTTWGNTRVLVCSICENWAFFCWAKQRQSAYPKPVLVVSKPEIHNQWCEFYKPVCLVLHAKATTVTTCQATVCFGFLELISATWGCFRCWCEWRGFCPFCLGGLGGHRDCWQSLSEYCATTVCWRSLSGWRLVSM